MCGVSHNDLPETAAILALVNVFGPSYRWSSVVAASGILCGLRCSIMVDNADPSAIQIGRD